MLYEVITPVIRESSPAARVPAVVPTVTAMVRSADRSPPPVTGDVVLISRDVGTAPILAGVGAAGVPCAWSEWETVVATPFV